MKADREPMPLNIGTRLGPYEIVAALGAGGMGEVYRARDTKLSRDVALKVLPDVFASDPDRLARFQREAHVLASLNHPNIAAIYGLEEANGVTALVLELVEGPTLAEIIAGSGLWAVGSRPAQISEANAERQEPGSRGPKSKAQSLKPGSARAQGLRVDEALPIARQIAEALEAAHEHGIIHRDLKPANVKVRPDGTVKVLDFGLAKLSEATGSGTSVGQGFSPAGTQDLSQSPTLTSPAAATRMGVILGTAAYMSPEQARGRPVDKRTDVWAFGAVLYEMVTGKRVFPGTDVTDVLAQVIEREPDFSALPAKTPPALQRLLRRCLEKDAKRRLPDIGVARLDIDDALSSPAGDVAAHTSPVPRSRWIGAVAVAVTAVVVVGLTAWSWGRFASPVPAPLKQFAISLPTGDQLFRIPGGLAVSPDGMTLVYVAQRASEAGGAAARPAIVLAGSFLQLFRWTLNQLEPVPIPGTEGALHPFLSPDGQSVAFSAGGSLRRVSLTGGPPVTICPAPSFIGGSWGAGDTIVFGTNAGLVQVAAVGGPPRPLTTIPEGQAGASHRFPQIVPGDKAVVFTIWTGSLDTARLAVASLETGEYRELGPFGGSGPRFSPTGHLLFAQAGLSIFAVPFDVDRLEPIGNPVPVLERVSVGTSPSTGGNPLVTIGSDGSLVYVPTRSAATPTRTLVWVDRAGRAAPLVDQPDNYIYPRLSPDGQRVAFAIPQDIDDLGSRADIWIQDLLRGTRTRVTFEGLNRFFPVWAPDGTRLMFGSIRPGTRGYDVYWTQANGSGGEEALVGDQYNQFPTSWSPDGRALAFYEDHPETRRDVWVLSMGAERTRSPILKTPFQERAPAFSPDGRWLAYVSDESGRDEVYVLPYPGPGGKVAISTGGGTEPVWSADGRELFYRSGDRMMMVAVKTAQTFAAGAPRVLFQDPYVRDNSNGAGIPNYDVSRDGQRFLVVKDSGIGATGEPDRIVVVQNWFQELKRLASAR